MSFYKTIKNYFEGRKAVTKEQFELLAEKGREACISNCVVHGHQFDETLDVCLCCGETIPFYCENCEKHFTEKEAKYRIENEEFTAPYGDTMTTGGGKYKVKTCPECGEDLEEL